MTEQEITRAGEILSTISADMANDAREFDGKPFNGRTVAEYLGNQGAAIAALADVLARIVSHLGADTGRRGA